MSTAPLYYQTPYETEFSASVISRESYSGKWHITLDRTLFYPGGGGQPSDKGTLSGHVVEDVRKSDKGFVHILSSDPEQILLKGRVDWNYRYHYMLQHTGQHLLSWALKSLYEINTLSVHLGTDTSTIEIDRENLTEEELISIEDLANRAIRENHAVSARILNNTEELAEYNIRRETDKQENIRLIRIGELDTAACAGVHINRTGELGLIKYTGNERIRGRLRLYWKIGEPAYIDYRKKHYLSIRAGRLLCAETDALIKRIDQVLKEKKAMNDELQKLEDISAESLVKSLSESITHYPPLIAHEIPEGSPGLFRQVVKKLSQLEGISFLLTMKHENSLQWALYLPRDWDFHFDQFREKCLPLINGNGGGNGPLWQGAGTDLNHTDEFNQAFLKLEGF